MNGIDHPERRQIRRIARVLQVAFRIPAGRELIAVLGNGTEHDNLEALTSWVGRRLSDPDPRLAEAALPCLTDELEQFLHRWEVESKWIA